MRKVCLAVALFPVLIAACASGTGGMATRPASLAPATQANAANFIVLAVANDPDSVSARAGSTGR